MISASADIEASPASLSRSKAFITIAPSNPHSYKGGGRMPIKRRSLSSEHTLIALSSALE
jgi:hypothetical protein